MEIKFSSKKREDTFKNLSKKVYGEILEYAEKKVKAYRDALKKLKVSP